MTRRHRHASIVRRAASVASLGALGAIIGGAFISQAWAAGDYPITQKQRSTAQQVASTDVPLSELSPNAPKAPTDATLATRRTMEAWRWRRVMCCLSRMRPPKLRCRVAEPRRNGCRRIDENPQSVSQILPVNP